MYGCPVTLKGPQGELIVVEEGINVSLRYGVLSFGGSAMPMREVVHASYPYNPLGRLYPTTSASKILNLPIHSGPSHEESSQAHVLRLKPIPTISHPYIKVLIKAPSREVRLSSETS